MSGELSVWELKEKMKNLVMKNSEQKNKLRPIFTCQSLRLSLKKYEKYLWCLYFKNWTEKLTVTLLGYQAIANVNDFAKVTLNVNVTCVRGDGLFLPKAGE